ncbi:hypothetical protein AAHE18_13G170800 [Arachis hypogaea]
MSLHYYSEPRTEHGPSKTASWRQTLQRTTAKNCETGLERKHWRTRDRGTSRTMNLVAILSATSGDGEIYGGAVEARVFTTLQGRAARWMNGGRARLRTMSRRVRR